MSNDSDIKPGYHQDFSLFPPDPESTSEDVPFTLVGALVLNGKYMHDFSELFAAILLWMALTYVAVHLMAFLVALVQLRNHPYVLFVAVALLLTALLGVCSAGAINSAALAWTLAAGQKQVSPWHCAFLGMMQTAILVVGSFSKILSSL